MPSTEVPIYVYTYTGNAFTTASGDTSALPSYQPSGHHISIMFVSSQSCALGVHDSDNYVISDGYCTLTNVTDPEHHKGSFNIKAIDSTTGLPTDWEITVGRLGAIGSTDVSLISKTDQDRASYAVVRPKEGYVPFQASNLSIPGKWNVTSSYSGDTPAPPNGLSIS
jgi:hypothetical protein